MNPVRAAVSAPIPCLLAAFFLLSSSPPEPTVRTAVIFSSAVVLTLHDHAKSRTFDACFARLREIDAEMNMWDETSELSRLNARAGQGPVPVSRDLVQVAARGLELAREALGIFDPSVAPLVRLWGIGSPAARMPRPGEIRDALALVDWRRVKVDEAAGTIELGPGMGLDFGALAKGFGAEEAGKLLSSFGVKSAILDVGGCILALGSAPKGSTGARAGGPWRIGVQDPLSARGTPLGSLALRDGAVDTSGTYERYFEAGGQARDRRRPHRGGQKPLPLQGGPRHLYPSRSVIFAQITPISFY